MTTASPVVSVVVVTYQAAEHLRRCLASIAVAARLVDGGVQVVVVDNASTDHSATVVRDAPLPIDLVSLDRNTGFAGGVAAGLAAAEAPWSLTLNNDATLAPEALRILLDVAEASPPDVGTVAAQMRFEHAPGTINSAGIIVDRLGVAADRHLGLPVADEDEHVVEVFGASAGAALYRTSMLNQVGGFDPTFFLYLEDVDLAWRARQRGWRSLYAPQAVVLHHHSASSGHGSPLKLYWVGRNRMRILARNMPTRDLVMRAPRIVAYELAHTAYATVAGRSSAPLRGRLAGLRRWRATRGTWQRRRVTLARPTGMAGALRRNAAWR